MMSSCGVGEFLINTALAGLRTGLIISFLGNNTKNREFEVQPCMLCLDTVWCVLCLHNKGDADDAPPNRVGFN